MFGLMRKKTHQRKMDERWAFHLSAMASLRGDRKEVKDSYLTLPAKMKDKYRKHSNGNR